MSSVRDKIKRNKSTLNDRMENKIHLINKNDILPNPKQHRADFGTDDELNGLADSIKRQGLLQPIIVKKINNGKFQLVAGQRRLLAFKKIDKINIPAIIRNNSDNELDALIENIQRKELTSKELGEICFKLKKEHHWKQRDIAKYLSKTEGWISEIIGDFEAQKNFGATKFSRRKIKAKTNGQLSFSFRWTFDKKLEIILNKKEKTDLEKKVVQLESLKNEINVIIDKAKIRKKEQANKK